MMPTRKMPARSPSQMMLGEWKSRITQVLAAAAGFASSSRHIATNSRAQFVARARRRDPADTIPSIRPISTSSASMSKAGMA